MAFFLNLHLLYFTLLYFQKGFYFIYLFLVFILIMGSFKHILLFLRFQNFVLGRHNVIKKKKKPHM